ncbi:hypothetical protein [Paenibacillus ehimensis]|uniref:Uncharacterized protein n=1 Tax=Paenibacillus ehimensis TaxID=79264 RepID=A0ABT8VM45_9BACL|nr:hypothetical protein [Paenibacillus ehimensis]MDO3682045.1 hypothetical protein [Paenibacillus ehimensis]MEC0207555.1 hypothetical protein [Paenibacillus ehimensis]
MKSIEERLNEYKERADSVSRESGEAAQAFALELIAEIERLSDENKRLRKALAQSADRRYESTKLRDALRE